MSIERFSPFFFFKKKILQYGVAVPHEGPASYAPGVLNTNQHVACSYGCSFVHDVKVSHEHGFLSCCACLCIPCHTVQARAIFGCALNEIFSVNWMIFRGGFPERKYSVWIAGSIWDDRWNESIRRGLEDPSCDAAAVQAFAGGRGRCKLSEAHQRVSSLLRQQSRIRGRSFQEKLMFHIGKTHP